MSATLGRCPHCKKVIEYKGGIPKNTDGTKHHHKENEHGANYGKCKKA